MAHCESYSQLMTQTVSGTPVESASLFYVANDDKNAPMIFSVDTQGQLNLILKDKSSNNTSIHLNASFQLPSKSVVTALKVTQDISGKLNLVFAENGNKIHIMSQVNLATMDWTQANLSSYLTAEKPGSSQPVNMVKIKDFLLGTNDNDNGPPSVVILYYTTDNLLDLTTIAIDATSNLWSYSNSMVLPESVTATSLTAMTIANINNYRGLYCLYTVAGPTSSTQHLAFIAPDPINNTQVQSIHDVTGLELTTLQSFSDSDGNSAVVAGSATGLYYLSSIAATLHRNRPQPLSIDPNLANVSELYLANTSKLLSVWTVNGKGQIVYQQFQSDMTPTMPSTILLKQAGPFAALLHPSDATQHLFVLDGKSKDGGTATNLTLLQQSPSTRLWKASPYLVPSIISNYEYTTYTVNIKILNPDGSILQAAASAQSPKVWLTSKTTITTVVNGEGCTLSPTGSAVKIDPTGSVTILIPTDDIATAEFTVSDMPKATTTYFAGKSFVIDPAEGVKSQIAKIKDSNTLQSQIPPAVKTQSPDFGSAGLALVTLNERINQFNQKPATSSNTPTTSEILTKSAVQTELDSHVPSASHVQSLSSDLWDIWHAVKTEVIDAVVDLAKDGLSLLLTIAGEVVTLALETVEHCLEAVAYVLKKYLGIDISGLIAWFGFLLEWPEILKTQKVLAAGFSQAFDLVIERIPAWISASTDPSSTWSTMGSQKPKLQRSITNTTFGKQQSSQSQASSAGSSNQTASSVTNHPGANYMSYNLQHGGMNSALEQNAPPSAPSTANIADTTPDPLQSLVNIVRDTLSTYAKTFTDTFEDLKSLVENPFTGDSLRSGIEKLYTDIIDDILNGLKKIVSDAGPFVVAALQQVKRIITQPLLQAVPLITPLWKTLTQGDDLNLLNVITLMLAVPTTVVGKLVTGNFPSAMPEYDELSASLAMPAASSQHVPRAMSAFSSGTDSNDKQVASIFKLIGKIIGAAEPLFGIYSLGTSITGWFAPSGTPSYVAITFSYIFAALSFPTDFFTNPSERPVPIVRALVTVAKLIQATVTASVGLKAIRGVMQVPVIGLRMILVVVSVVEDATASTTEYPALNYDLLWMYEVARIVDMVSQLGNTLALASSGQNDIACGVYVIGQGMNIMLSETVSVNRLLADAYVNAAHVPNIGMIV